MSIRLALILDEGQRDFRRFIQLVGCFSLQLLGGDVGRGQEEPGCRLRRRGQEHVSNGVPGFSGRSSS